MAGTAKPSIDGLGVEVTLTIIDAEIYSGDSTASGLFDGVLDSSWGGTSVCYFQNTDDYIEFTVDRSINIWRCGHSSYPQHCGSFTIEQKQDDDTYVDITEQIIQATSSIDGETWEKTIENLPAGTYKFTATASRMDSEWYVEAVTETVPFSVHKVTKSELPSSVESTDKDYFYITDDGGVYVSKVDGSLTPIGVDKDTRDRIDFAYENSSTAVNNIVETDSATIYAYPDKHYLRITGVYNVHDTYDETEDILKDVSYYEGHSLTLPTNKPTVVLDTDLNRNVFQFNGSNQYVCLGHNENIKSSYISVFVKAKLDDWTTFQGRLISCSQSGGFYIYPDGDALSFGIYVGGWKYIEYPLSDISSGWHVIAATYDGCNYRLYIDKEVVSTSALNTTKTPITYHSSNGIFIGAEAGTSASSPNSSSGTEFFNGCISDARFYSVGLASGEVCQVIDDINEGIYPQYAAEINVNGDYTENNYYEVVDVTNPLTTEELEYGTFKMSADVSSLTVKTIIPFDAITIGNMDTPTEGKIKLNANKTYIVEFDMYAEASTEDSISIECYNTSTDEVYFTGTKVPVSNTAHMIESETKGFISPSEDIEIGFRLSQAMTLVYSEHSYVNVREFRNNPVNQYGGFEMVTLFDGNADAVGTYTLAEDSTDYDYLIIMTKKVEETSYVLPPMTSNTEPSPLVITYSSFYGGSYSVWGVFDQEQAATYNCWMSNNESPAWIQIDTGTNTQCSGVILGGRTYNAVSIMNWVIEGSYDDSVWEEIISDTETVPKTETTYMFGKTVDYRYYRITGEANSGTSVCLGSFDLVTHVNRFQTNFVFNLEGGHYIDNDEGIVSIENSDIVVTQIANPIAKVIGVKGQLPSMLIGGKF